tara:strand:+ start:303 stop:695 length:393 start_codon:yes stop_codon:yes gene_type:complete
MKLNKNSLMTLVEEVIKESREESVFPALKSYRKLSRGIMETDETEEEDSVLLAGSELLEESGDTITMKEFNALMNRVIGIFQLMPPDLKKNKLREFGRRFGLMSMNDFMVLQNRMSDSQKGKLDDEKVSK